MALFPKFRRRWRMAGYLAQAEADGQVLIIVPAWQSDEVRRTVWLNNVQRASDRWAAKINEIPVTEWQAAISRVPHRTVEQSIESSIRFQSAAAEAGRHRAARPRRWPGSKVLPVPRIHPAVTANGECPLAGGAVSSSLLLGGRCQ